MIGSPLITITPWMQWKASGDYTFTRFQSASALSMGYLQCLHASPSKHVEWDVALIAGTWRLTLIYVKSTDAGILTPSLGGVDLATQDMYNGSTAYNNVTQWSGIAVAVNGVKELRLRTDTKNASANRYDIYISGISLLRTGN